MVSRSNSINVWISTRSTCMLNFFFQKQYFITTFDKIYSIKFKFRFCMHIDCFKFHFFKSIVFSAQVVWIHIATFCNIKFFWLRLDSVFIRWQLTVYTQRTLSVNLNIGSYLWLFLFFRYLEFLYSSQWVNIILTGWKNSRFWRDHYRLHKRPEFSKIDRFHISHTCFPLLYRKQSKVTLCSSSLWALRKMFSQHYILFLFS